MEFRWNYFSTIMFGKQKAYIEIQLELGGAFFFKIKRVEGR